MPSVTRGPRRTSACPVCSLCIHARCYSGISGTTPCHISGCNGGAASGEDYRKANAWLRMHCGSVSGCRTSTLDPSDHDPVRLAGDRARILTTIFGR